MRLKVIGCDVLARALYLYAAQSPHTIDIELFRYGLHQHPDDLRARLQQAIEATRGQGYVAVLLAYALCGKSTHGLVAGDTQLVMPRAHDCITLFLGSRARYRQQFEQVPGTYWYVQDYLERDDGSGVGLAIGAETGADAEATYASYVEKYGRDNAEYLMEIMGAWQSHYQRAGLIDLGVGDASLAERRAREDAAKRGWTFERLPGDLGLVRRLLYGEWDDDFLVVPPGQTISMTFDDNVLCCQ
jgi:hypothetical protein